MKTTNKTIRKTIDNKRKQHQAVIHRQQFGFTLIELMAVLVILAVLLTVALPAYRDQVIKGHRAEAKAQMLEIANRQEQFLLSNRTYTASKTDISYVVPPDVVPFYSFSISTLSATGAPFYEITATALGNQLEDGDLTLNSRGEKTPADKWKR